MIHIEKNNKKNSTQYYTVKTVLLQIILYLLFFLFKRKLHVCKVWLKTCMYIRKYFVSIFRVLGHFEKPIFLELCRYMETKNLRAEEHLFRVGEPDDSIYVVQSGKLNVYITERVRDIVLMCLDCFYFVVMYCIVLYSFHMRCSVISSFIPFVFLCLFWVVFVDV